MTSARHEPHALLTIPEAAQRLHLSDDTVRRQIREGDLPAIRLGTTPTGRARYRISQAVVDGLLNRAAVPTRSAAERLQEVFAVLSDDQREALIVEAIRWAREGQEVPVSEGLSAEPSPEEIRTRFAGSRLRPGR
ncbi:helix-turn-helix domain-containing protein [Deinococcus altitudinis]|uniref:helix-turn-helix domain-containing protein n=1 Tax=Deinococcus altitudinis TaxID=468914 RepID=UPI0038912D48